MRYKAQLVEWELWQQFYTQQNEMIITKAGRCLFPLLRIEFHLIQTVGNNEVNTIDLEAEFHYRVELEIGRHDDHKWKWRHGRWTPLLTSRAFGDNARDDPKRIVFHEHQSGVEIISNGLNFDKLKLTNRDDGQLSVCLQSFHRYIPIVRLILCDGPTPLEQTIRFTETEFIAVTHYQNEQVTLLKKSYNPHAKGFVINEDLLSTGSMDWVLTPEYSDSPSSVPSIRKRKRVRKRIYPINAVAPEPTSATIPSDEEELQGGLALQFLSKKNSP